MNMNMLLRRLRPSPLRQRALSLSLARRSPLLTSAFPAAAHVRALSGTAETDTIYALSSAEGKAGVAVVRISGGQAETCLQALSKTEKLPLPRMCVVCCFRNLMAVMCAMREWYTNGNGVRFT